MSWAVFAAFALWGVGAAAPSVSFGDGGEYAAAAATLSVAHPPGYPLYVLAGKAFGTLLPWATWAWRLNLLSGVCAAAALALLFDAARRLGAAAPAALLGTLFAGLTPLWLHANAQAEVFALNALLAAACAAVVARAGARAWGSRTMAALGLLLGLGSGNHHTLALAVPAYLGAALLAARPSAREAARGLAVFAAFGLSGFAIQLALPLRALAFPPLDWGHPVDLARFLRVLLRKDYGSFSLTIEGAAKAGGPLRQTARWLAAVWRDFGPAGAALAALGLGTLALAPQGRPYALLAGGLAALPGPLFLVLGDPPFDPQTSYALERFWLLPWLGVALLAAVGAGVLWRSSRAGKGAVLALLLVPPLAAWRAAPAWGQRWDLAAHDYGADLLRSLPPGAALFIDGGDDTFYTLADALYADGRRPDLEVHDRGGLVFRSAYGADFRGLPRDAKEARRRQVELAYARQRPTFYATLNRDMNPGGRLLLWGLLRRLEPLPPAGPEREAPEGRALWSAYTARRDEDLARAHYRYRALVPFYHVMRAAAESARGEPEAALADARAALAEGGDVLWVRPTVSGEAQWAGWAAAQAKRWDSAAAAYRLSVDCDPGRAEAWTNLGAVLERMGRLDEARAAHERAAALAPQSFAARFNLGSALYKAGLYARAAEEFAAAARLRPQDAAAAHWAEASAARAGGPSR